VNQQTPKKDTKKKDPRFQRLLTVEETSSYLGISPHSIYNAVSPKSAKEFPVKPLRLGRAIRFDVRDLDTYIEGLKNGS
jgi:predicted DNA-binding transcriptional regulator AlpA